jgi:hypothetical protein
LVKSPFEKDHELKELKLSLGKIEREIAIKINEKKLQTPQSFLPLLKEADDSKPSIINSIVVAMKETIAPGEEEEPTLKNVSPKRKKKRGMNL